MRIFLVDSIRYSQGELRGLHSEITITSNRAMNGYNVLFFGSERNTLSSK